ncbi:MAG: type II secretion system GspH family protein [Nitrospirales bacterium]|nr:type II secretion system protein [Nitrospira sp.]MDR4500546.1 type II secretion system GspH family protein [Nitrospirales bacterium]
MDLRAQSGLSLLETIGAVSIGAVLAAITVPHVYDLIADSKAESLVASTKVYQHAISRYYADIGTVLPLDGLGIPRLEPAGNSANPKSLPARLTLAASGPQAGTVNLWSRFQGPYLEKFDTRYPPELGETMYMPTIRSLSLGVSVTGSNHAWDLKGDDGKNDIPTNATVVMLRVVGLTPEQFLRVDKIIEPDIGATATERRLRGRAKYDSTDMTLNLYLAHQ